MNKTRLSLCYLASYLWIGGVGFLFAPDLTAQLFLSNTEYASVMLQTVGMFLIGIGIIIIQIIRLHVQSLYSTTLIVRVFLCLTLVIFYLQTSNPLFLVIFSIAVLGLLLTGSFYLLEHRSQSTGGVFQRD